MKSLFPNLVALAAFSAAAAAAGLPLQEALLFQLAAQWLVNELWFDAYLVPALLMQLFGGKGEEREQARQRRAARWTSFCLLLFPALLFGLLALVQGVSGGALGNWLGLPLGAGLYTCSFAGFAVLFILVLFTGAMPLSVQAALEQLLDDKLDSAQEDMRQSIRQEAATATPPPPLPQAAAAELSAIPCHHSAQYAAHEHDFARKCQPGEQLLLATAPAAPVPAPGEGQGYLFGSIFGAAGLFILYVARAAQLGGDVSGFALGAIYFMGCAFLLIVLPLFLQPLRWRRRMKGLDYFITDRRLIIYRGSEQFIRLWSEPCVTHLEARSGSRGDVEVIRKGIGYNILRGFFKRWAGASEAETRASFDKGRFTNGEDMQKQALINVEGAEAIHRLIEGLLAQAQERQER